MYHPAAALRTPAIERESYDDVARIPAVLIASRERRAGNAPTATSPTTIEADRGATSAAATPAAESAAEPIDQLSLF